MDHRPLPNRFVALVVASLLSAVALTVTTGCDPVSRDWAWTLGKTHGAIIETTAGRASLGVYRAPSRTLYEILIHHGGLDAVQDVLWAFGKPPALKKTFSYQGRSLTLEFGAGTKALAAVTKKLIYDDDSDLLDGLAHAHYDDNCLALTLVSYGKPTSNWTNKSVGCQTGSLPR